MSYMDRSITIRIPEVLAAKIDRLAAVDGMTTSELVRQALRVYISSVMQNAFETVSREVAPALKAEGVTAETAESWYKAQRKKKGKSLQATGVNCASS